MPVERVRFSMTAVAALLAAGAVSVAGLIGFVGLVVPHIVRLIIGTDYKYVIPGSAILGAGVLVFCDTLGRVAFSPIEIPAGIIMAFLGAPFFLYLLRRSSVISDDIAIKISDVHVSFGNHHVLKGASGEIKKGSIVTFLGRNGCGK